MEGKITNTGALFIKRGKTYKFQNCPYNSDEIGPNTCCGDHCALFGEPHIEHSYLEHKYETEDCQTVSLSLCNKTLIFKKFSDERS